MADDIGFGASSVFGGPIPTPNFQKLADQGLRFNRFHTTGMCSPSRASLLTGRNHHAVGFGAITEAQAGFPGYSSELPADSRTIAEVLGRAGYSTSMFGKAHMVSSWQFGLTGSHRQWPTDLGFGYFYGFLAADADQWHPSLYRGTSLVDPRTDYDGLLDSRLADDAIRWIHQQKAETPDKPFFAYLAPGSTHAPHQAPADWIARFRGKFDGGWDAVRAETVARQRQLGLLPANAAVTPRPAQLAAWNSLSAAEQLRFARFMEVYAAQLAYQDAQIGRIIAELQRMGQWENTLVVVILGDNGASAEGGLTGTLSELRTIIGAKETLSDKELADLDRLGSPDSYQNYPVGWAWAMNAPYPLFKQNASHLGGVRNGMIVSWPRMVAAPGRTVTDFAHVTDIVPTLLQATQVERPAVIDGVTQAPIQGQSLLRTLTDPASRAPGRTQYFELYGNRALYRDGWWASTVPGRMPWEQLSTKPAEEFDWQLFDLRTDPAQANDLAAKHPDVLRAMQREWLEQARANNVLPLRADGRTPAFLTARRPRKDRDLFEFWGSDVHLPWTDQPDLARGSFTIDVEFGVPGGTAGDGALLATGSAIGGWSLKLEQGVPVLYVCASEAAADRFRIAGSARAEGRSQRLQVRFAADGPAAGAGGLVTMVLDGQTIASQQVGARAIRISAQAEMFDIGMDTGASVVPGMIGPQRFNGQIAKVTIATRQGLAPARPAQ